MVSAHALAAPDNKIFSLRKLIPENSFSPPLLARGFSILKLYIGNSKNLTLDLWPETSRTLVFGTLKYSARSSTTARLALPSTAGSRTRTSKDPSNAACISGPFLLPGFTRTVIFIFSFARCCALGGVQALKARSQRSVQPH